MHDGMFYCTAHSGSVLLSNLACDHRGTFSSIRAVTRTRMDDLKAYSPREFARKFQSTFSMKCKVCSFFFSQSQIA